MNSRNHIRQGFTVIELLIVLAIAGLILLIVFLAVPAMQRNARNTGYRKDAANLLAVTTEYMNNNSGVVPGPADAGAVQALIRTPRITYLQIVTMDVSPIAAAFDTATLDTGVQCPGSFSGNSITPLPSSGSALAIIFAIEDNHGNPQAQCLNA